MTETDELYNRIMSLDRKIENIDAKLAITISSNPEVLKAAMDLFTTRIDTLTPLYLAVDGQRNVTEIATDLGKDIGNTSRYLREIHERGYIDKIDEAKNGGAIYKKNQFEKILRLSEKIKTLKKSNK